MSRELKGLSGLTGRNSERTNDDSSTQSSCHQKVQENTFGSVANDEKLKSTRFPLGFYDQCVFMTSASTVTLRRQVASKPRRVARRISPVSMLPSPAQNLAVKHIVWFWCQASGPLNCHSLHGALGKSFRCRCRNPGGVEVPERHVVNLRCGSLVFNMWFACLFRSLPSAVQKDRQCHQS